LRRGGALNWVSVMSYVQNYLRRSPCSLYVSPFKQPISNLILFNFMQTKCRKCERPHRRRSGQLEDGLLGTVQHGTNTSVTRTVSRLGTPRTTVWRTAHKFAREEFCHSLFHNRVLWTKVLFAHEAFFNKDGITNTRNSKVSSPQKRNLHSNTETHFQTRFSVNI
jgi:hypothetical protein